MSRCVQVEDKGEDYSTTRDCDGGLRLPLSVGKKQPAPNAHRYCHAAANDPTGTYLYSIWDDGRIWQLFLLEGWVTTRFIEAPGGFFSTTQSNFLILLRTMKWENELMSAPGSLLTFHAKKSFNSGGNTLS